MSILDAALAQVALGRQVLALHGIRGGQCSCGRSECKNPGKHPYYDLCPHGLKNATTDPETVRSWLAARPWLNYGIVWGRISGAFAVDLDVKPSSGIDGRESWADLCDTWGPIADTETVLTGSGGLHLIFAYPDLPEGQRIAPNQGVVGQGVDIRGDDSYTVGPGCAHISGRRYEYESASDPDDTDDPIGPAIPPPGLVEMIVSMHHDNRPVPDLPDDDTISTDTGWRSLKESRSRLLYAPDGERLDARCAAGMRAGRLVAGGMLNAKEALDALLEDALRNTSQPEREIRRTLTNYMRIGLKYPWEPNRPRAEVVPPPGDEDAPPWALDPAPVPTPQDAQASAAADPWLCWASVVPRSVRWLWTGYVPRGKVTVLAGLPGTSKTTLCLMVAAGVTRGRRLPGDNLDDPVEGSVGIISTEDDVDDTLVPRAEAAGADLSRIASWKEAFQLPSLPGSQDALIRWIRARNIRMLVVDPLSALKGEHIDAHKDADVRSVMAALKAAASITDCAVVGIAHLNKVAGQSAVARVGGSGAWVAAARSALLCSADPDGDQDDLMLSVIKSNLSRARATSRLRRVSVGDPDGAVYRLDWMGNSEATADELVCSPTGGRPSRERSAAAAWLAEELAYGSRPAAEVYEAAEAANISKSTLLRAKAEMKVDVIKSATGRWLWYLEGEGAHSRAGL